MSERDDFEQWLVRGYEAGWISDVQCLTHEGIPMSDAEMESWDEGNDDCFPVVRIYGLERVLPWEE